MTAAALAAAPTATVAVQLREKDLDACDLLELARSLRVICDRFGAPRLVNDRIDVAIAARADGVHLPADSFAVADARSLLGNGRLIGVSTHMQAELIVAAHAGADFAVYGPVFDPLSKERYAEPCGIAGLMRAVAATPLPIFALGGITSGRSRELGAAQVSGNSATRKRPAGVATIGAIYGAPDPAAAMRDLLDAIASW